MAKAGKKRTRRATKPPLPPAMEQQRAEAERLRPFAKQLREDYKRDAAEASEMVKAREAITRALRPTPPAPAPPPAPTPPPTPIIPVTWVDEEVKSLKAQGVAYAGIGKHKLARELVGRMQTAVRSGLVPKLWSVGHMANQLSVRGLWPVH